jgi:2-polyprenyl-3-methyl-5-hydroxy-6-metoxy-1,4-benzoquinol methylase
MNIFKKIYKSLKVIYSKSKKSEKKYCIDASYICRNEYFHYNDLEEKDQWQLEVYLHGLGLMKKNKYKNVVDIGCGSAYKLITYLSEYQTTGYEVPVNVTALKKMYPSRKWEETNFKNTKLEIETDVIICADVIEHLVDPDELINYLKTQEFKFLILSTPARELVYSVIFDKNDPGLRGPPRNPAHQREWTFNEFKEYISKNFNIIEHRIVNYHQATQMIICTKLESKINIS